MSPRRVLITGADGFLGRAAVAAFEGAGWEVAAASRGAKIRAGGLRLDFDDPRWIEGVESLPAARAIVHLAGPVDLSPSCDPSMFVSTCIDGTTRLGALALRWKARLVVASSVAVFGPVTHMDASTPLDPRTPYARAKVEAERAAARAGTPWTALRLSGIFGASGPAHLGLNRSIDAVLRGERPVLVGDGEGRRNYVYVRDAADAILSAVENGTDGPHCVAGSEALTVREMLATLSSVLGRDGVLDRRPGPSTPDLVVTPSPEMPKGRSFRSALADIRLAAGRSAAC